MSPEDGLLLISARPRSDDETCAELEKILTGPVAWNDVLERSIREGTAALLEVHLSASPSASARLPAVVRTRLAAISRTTWAHNAVLIGRCADMLRELGRAGVPCLVHKGMALIHTLYPDIGVRPMADIDLLVRPADVPVAARVLEAAGYRTAGGEVEAAERLRSFLVFVRDSTMIDLHWHLADYTRFDGIVRVDHAGVWARARRLVVGDVETMTPSPEDTLLHLALHLTLGSEFGRLIWFSDIDALVRTAAETLDWARVLDEAGRWRVRTLLGYTLGVAHASLGTPVPAGALVQLRPGPGRRTLLGACVGLAAPPTLRGPLAESRMYLGETLLMDRLRDVLRVLWRSAFPSAAWVRLHYALRSDGQVALHRALHPLRVCYLAVKHLR